MDSIDRDKTANETPKREERAKKRPSKNKKDDKNSIINSLRNFFVNIHAEYKKIIWPKKEELAKQTLVVIILCLIFGLLIFGMDTGFASILKLVAGTI